MKKTTVAIIGASGLVGQQIIKIIKEKKLNDLNFIFFASKNNANKTISLFGKKHTILLLNKKNIKQQKIDYAIFATPNSVSKKFAPICVLQGATVIDNSSAFRKTIAPICIPQINSNTLKKNTIVCNPNCSTAISVLPLATLCKKYTLQSVVFCTYQAVSGAGKSGLDFFENSKKPNPFVAPIKNNVVAQIGNIKNNTTTEEEKMIFETQKILNTSNIVKHQNKKIDIVANCVRVPIKNCHSIFVLATFKENININTANKLLKKANDITLLEKNQIATPLLANNKNNVFVCKTKNGYSKNQLSFFVCGDNLRRGAALNAVEILQCFLNN